MGDSYVAVQHWCGNIDKQFAFRKFLSKKQA